MRQSGDGSVLISNDPLIPPLNPSLVVDVFLSEERLRNLHPQLVTSPLPHRERTKKGGYFHSKIPFGSYHRASLHRPPSSQRCGRPSPTHRFVWVGPTVPLRTVVPWVPYRFHAIESVDGGGTTPPPPPPCPHTQTSTLRFAPASGATRESTASPIHRIGAPGGM